MSTTPEDQTEPAVAAAASPDDLREKFRAALDRKHGKGTDSAGDSAAGAGGGSKASARTSNSKRQREFRRKSGG
jgi:Family of unknown function (DUF5302)